MAIVKVLVGEVEGVEDCEGTERILDARDVRVLPTISGFDNVDDVLRNVTAPPGTGGVVTDACVGGVSPSYVFMSEQCVGGGDANGD